MACCIIFLYVCIVVTLQGMVVARRGILVAVANSTKDVFCVDYCTSGLPLPQCQADALMFPFLDLTPWTGCDVSNESTKYDVFGKVVAVISANCTVNQTAKLIEENGGKGVLLTTSPELSSYISECNAENWNISLAFISKSTLNRIKALGSDVNVLQYAPTESSRMDCSLIVIWFMAMLSVSFGACWSRKVKYCLSKYHPNNQISFSTSEDSHKEMSNREGALNVSPMLVIFFVACMCGMLLLLYFFYDYLVYVIIGMFSLASTLGLYQCLEPFILMFPFGNCRLPTYTTRYCVIGLEVRQLVLFLGCAGLTIAWFVLRKESYAWMLQDILGIAFTINMLNVIRLPSFKICTILLVLLFFYDIFFVFVTPLFTMSGKSVMVEVATGGSSDEQMPMVLKVPHLNADVFSFCFPQYSLLGFGDILVPGLLVSYCYNFDAETGTRKVYFISVLIAYGIGLLITYGALYLMSRAQPALLYLVPSTLLSVAVISLCRKEFKHFWNGETEVIVESDDSQTSSSNPTDDLSWAKTDSLDDETQKPLSSEVSRENSKSFLEDNALLR